MAGLRDVMLYLCAEYPHPGDLSKARLTKMVYLADWRSALQRGRQLTSITWRFNHFGPYVDDIVDLARQDPAFTVVGTSNMYGEPKEVIKLSDSAAAARLDPDERAVLDHVVRETRDLYWKDFIELVYSTYPIVTQPRYTPLDLVSLARDYA